MAAKKRVFRNHVHIRNPITSQTDIFEPGDEEPDYVDKLDFEIDPGNFVQDDDVWDEESGEFVKEKPDYSKLSKAELTDLMKERTEMDMSPGSKEDFVARLQAHDAAHG